MSSFRECCTARCRLQTNDRSPTLCAAAMRPLAALSAFLDVSSLNLAVPQAPPFFSRRLNCGDKVRARHPEHSTGTARSA